MARYQVIISYDGTRFSGFQRQVEVRTVQGVVEHALREIGWGGDTILGAGRTDAGVHASGQVIAFDMSWTHTPEALGAALNANLPPDVAVKNVGIASAKFHPRYDAVGRLYRYRIYCQPARDPLRERYAWRVWPEPDEELLCQSAEYLLGEHDFAAFGTPPLDGGTTKREVMHAEWRSISDEWFFEITANAFLYHMVRRLVSFQVSIGEGKREPSAILEHLNHPDVEPVLGLAPAHGLNLVQVLYPS